MFPSLECFIFSVIIVPVWTVEYFAIYVEENLLNSSMYMKFLVESRGAIAPTTPPGLCPWIQDEEILSLIALSLYIFFYKIMPTCHIMWIPHSAYSSKLCSCKSESNCHSEDSILLSSEWSEGNSTFSFTSTCPFSFTLGSSTYRVL